MEYAGGLKDFDIEKHNKILLDTRESLVSYLKETLDVDVINIEELQFKEYTYEHAIYLRGLLKLKTLDNIICRYVVKELYLSFNLYYDEEQKFFFNTLRLEGRYDSGFHHNFSIELIFPEDGSDLYLIYYLKENKWGLMSRNEAYERFKRKVV
jgi:hypothetical protein